METELASMWRSDDLGRRVLGFIKGSPRASALTQAYDLVAKFHGRPAMYPQADPLSASRTTSMVVFKDFDEFADAINGIAGRFVPTARAEADWWVQVVPVGRVAIQQIQIGGAATFAGEGADNALTIGIPVAQPKCIRIDGEQLDDSSFIVVKERQPFTFAAKQATRWAGITVPVDHPSLSQELRTALSAYDAPGTTRARAHLEQVVEARKLVTRLCTTDGGVAFFDTAAVRAAEEEIMAIANHLFEASSRASPRRLGRPQFSRDRVIARALAFIEERRGEALLIQDLCAAAQVSERTLRNIFQERFGVGPMRLIRARQLREIRCALLSPGASEHTVSRIAARFGVWDFSLFARNYKALFGETPVQTLRSGAAARTRAGAMNATWLRYAAAKFPDADRDALAALTSMNSQFDALIRQQRKLVREIDGYAEDLHGFAAWAREFSRSQFGETRGSA